MSPDTRPAFPPLYRGRPRWGVRKSMPWAGAAFALALAVLGWTRYSNYWSTTLDMGVFDQGVWLLSKGLMPHSTVLGKNLFADHLSLVLVPLAALYRVHASPAWLIGVQGIALALTVFPVARLARDEGVPEAVGVAAVVLSAPLWAAGLYDFHPATLAVPALAWALLGARRGDARMCVVAGAVVLVCRADLAWVLLGTAIVARPPARRALITVGVSGVVVAVVAYALIDGRGTWYVHYGRLGSGPADAVLHPYRLVLAVLGLSSLREMGAWLLPVGFLAVARPRWLLAVFVAGFPLLVSASPNTHAPWFHYGALVTPLAIGGALTVIGERADSGRPLRIAGAGCALALLTISPWAPRAPDPYRVWNVVAPSHNRDFDRAVQEVGPHDVVAAGDRLLPHVDHRRLVWPFPAPFKEVTPAGLGPRPSRAEVRRVDVIIAEPQELQGVALPGFHRVGPRLRAVVVLRR
jgi:uncharacterized membrane protein